MEANERPFFLTKLVPVACIDQQALSLNLNQEALHLELETVPFVGRGDLRPQGLGYQPEKAPSILPVGSIGHEMQCHSSQLHDETPRVARSLG
jgi:hypothetical protein